jgi:hypothetical protein
MAHTRPDDLRDRVLMTQAVPGPLALAAKLASRRVPTGI